MKKRRSLGLSPANLVVVGKKVINKEKKSEGAKGILVMEKE